PIAGPTAYLPSSTSPGEKCDTGGSGEAGCALRGPEGRVTTCSGCGFQPWARTGGWATAPPFPGPSGGPSGWGGRQRGQRKKRSTVSIVYLPHASREGPSPPRISPGLLQGSSATSCGAIGPARYSPPEKSASTTLAGSTTRTRTVLST